MPRREKTRIAGKRQGHVVPMTESMDQRVLAKHPLQHRGGSLPPARKRAGRKNAR
ncbi:MAG TPA: hypothetical protein VGQ69_13175 [Gemmatimonadales bacterium]|jgi:hypothetical protein|nr:hypothetical protein [Gemmatimonadales bacterium]